MTASKFFAVSLISLSTLGAGAALAAGHTPFAGEQPFANALSGFSFSDRAAVQAEGERSMSQLAVGENSRVATLPVSHQSRSDVRAAARTALAHDQIAAGEFSLAVATAGSSDLNRAEVRADARRALSQGLLPAAGEFN